MSRKHSGSQTVQKRASMTTEYQERFLSPLCYKAIVSAPSHKGPYHALKGTSADVRYDLKCLSYLSRHILVKYHNLKGVIPNIFI